MLVQCFVDQVFVIYVHNKLFDFWGTDISKFKRICCFIVMLNIVIDVKNGLNEFHIKCGLMWWRHDWMRLMMLTV